MVDRLNTLYSVLKASEPKRAGDLAVPRTPWSVLIFEFTKSRWAYSSVGLEHTPDKREVGSSSLPGPTSVGPFARAGV